MSGGSADPTRFLRWIARPQSLIALSALLLSACGLFIALYAAALIRRQQRASAWPYVEIGASWSRERLRLWVRNAGVGPARVRAAAVRWEGETRKGWADRLGVEALRLMGFRAYQAHRAAQTFRRHDEVALRELAAMRHDRKLYLGAARQRIKDLESLLQGDLADPGETRDAGWDPESLRQEYGGRASGERSE